MLFNKMKWRDATFPRWGRLLYLRHPIISITCNYTINLCLFKEKAKQTSLPQWGKVGRRNYTKEINCYNAASRMRCYKQ